MGATLTDQVRKLVDDCAAAASGEAVARLTAARDRLDEPLRVAIVGKVKAGKSTLLNALVGEPLAPTDAGECTRIVTWYREGVTYGVTMTPRNAPPRAARFQRVATALDVDLDGLTPDDVERLDVQWPSSALHDMTLIDTPGLGSLTAELSEQTRLVVAPDDEEPGEADAVLYLMRHMHAD
ncbi:MAG TPA: dynamin family protein, partial [Acidimicrobiia bacterium]